MCQSKDTSLANEDHGDVDFNKGVILVITTEIDFTTQTDNQTESCASAACDSPTENELADMMAIGETLRAYRDAEEQFKVARATFASQFDANTALRIAAFRDAYWQHDKNGNVYGHVIINGVEMSWNDFIDTVFGVTRQWLNTLLRRYLAPKDGSNDNNETAKSELLSYVKSLDEDGASALLGQINDNFETDQDEGDEPTLDDVQDLRDEDSEADNQPTAIDEATARIKELEAEVEQLKAQLATPQDAELLTEKEKVLAYAKRITGGRAELLKLHFEEIAAKLGLDDRIVITVE